MIKFGVNMKKIIIICISAVFLVCCISCTASVTNETVSESVSNKTVAQKAVLNGQSVTAFSNDDMDNYLKLFLGVDEANPDGILGSREAFSESEEKTAQRIKEYALSLKDNTGESVYKVELRKFSTTGGSSQNVVIKKKNNIGGKQVIIGTNYDNLVASASSLLSTGSGSTESINAGALENGTGCALMYALLDYFKTVSLDFDITFIFFGAASYYNSGAASYVNDMTDTEVNNTLLMLNLHRFGGENLYLYTDEVANGHHEYIKNIALNDGVELNNIPKSLPVINARVTERYPYTTWALAGAHAPFLDKYLNVANIYSANYSYFSILDNEVSGQTNRSFTKDDTYTALKSELPHFSAQMNDVASIIISLLSDAAFKTVMEDSRNNLKAYNWALSPMIAYIAVMVIVCGLGIILFLLVSRFNKKYPYVPNAQRKENIAVFGSDYEKK